ncbi:MATE family efflux transporter [Sporosarcina sp. Te-1]|uniref:MATE family efflux transporter n=1 Tax=Sporosarcina sp. Te-1 TaxID=2818390 RepID=UPI001A9D5712|nr:MATE family efflux transporter [Sporosarcina sp. Te-1]QTD40883.1 polysaccharide biosynthesis C-terminal domain-containing protein [Sporosarcina sp. Te-1]
MKAKELDLLHDKVPYLFRNFAIPGILSSLSMCLYGIINGLILGRYVGSNAMAAVNMASPIFNIISCIAILIAIGGNTLVGISLGEKDHKKANHHFNNAVTALFVIALVIWVVVVFFPSSLAQAVGANDVLLPYVKSYIQTFGFFIIPVLFNIIFGMSLQSIGKPQLYMIGSMLTMALNIILDLLFICVFNWGVFGAALASGISASIVFFIFLPHFMRKDGILKIGKYKFNWKAFMQMAYNGSSRQLHNSA